MSSTVEQIKDRVGIVDLVSSYIKLERAGKHFKARCPFHNEKTPSFFVSPERETFHCFGCGKGGDIFSFVEEMEGIDFAGALKILADRAGIKIPRYDSGKTDEMKRLYDVLEEATAFFESERARREDVTAYLLSRGLTSKTIEGWRIGYAPDEWRALFHFLKKKNFKEDDMLRAGLTAVAHGKTFDRFRGRVMFPISDSSGRIIAFSGRIFDPRGEKKDVAKYINSPETALYDKSRVLYGFDKAKHFLRKHDACLIVEGQFDVVLSHQAGVEHAVAASGTALSDKHLSYVRRFTENVVLAFDADEAGFKASERSIALALAAGFSVSAVSLPLGLDPADFIKKEGERWAQAVKSSKHVIEFYIVTLMNRYTDPNMLYVKIEENVIPLISQLKSPIVQAHFVKMLAGALKMSEEPVWSSVRQAASRLPQKKTDGIASRATVSVQNPEVYRLVQIQNRLVGFLAWRASREETDEVYTAAFGEFQKELYENFTEESLSTPADRKEQYAFEAELAYGDSNDLQEAFRELVGNFYRQYIRVELLKTLEEVRVAEVEGNEAKAKEALSRCAELSKKLNTPPLAVTR